MVGSRCEIDIKETTTCGLKRCIGLWHYVASISQHDFSYTQLNHRALASVDATQQSPMMLDG